MGNGKKKDEIFVCNMAGYAGNRRAAPILLELLRVKGVVYEPLRILRDRGCIEIDIVPWPGPGAAPHLTRGTFFVRLVKEP